MFGKFKAGKPEFIVAGLGNPGIRYDLTRHNAGFMALDFIAREKGINIDRFKWKALTGEGEIAGEKVLFLKPQTYMNNSGEAVVEAMNFYKLPPERVIIIFDDVSLPVGALRFRKSGSSGGQKGVKDIIEASGSENFLRIKIGVGAKPHPDYELADWVLSKLAGDDLKAVEHAIKNVPEVLECVIKGEHERAQNLAGRVAVK